MPSRIRIGPEGGPYVIVDENNGVLDITTPNDEVDFGDNDLINAALGGVLDAKGNDITNVDALNSNSVNTEQLDTKFEYLLRDNESLQQLINRADEDGVKTVKVPPGSYDKINVPEGMQVVGSGNREVRVDVSDSGVAGVTLADSNASLQNIEVVNDENFNIRLDAPEGRLTNVTTRGSDRSIIISENVADRCRIVDCDLNNTDVIIGNDCVSTVVVGNVGVGTVIDDGSGSEVSSNS